MANKTKEKRMTAKEFKKIFNESGYSFEIWGWEGILNMLSIYHQLESDRSKEKAANTEDEELKGIYTSCANSEEKRSFIIYNALKEFGFYD